MRLMTVAALLLFCAACSREPAEFSVGECVAIKATGAPGTVLKLWFSRRGAIVRVTDPTLPPERLMVIREYDNAELEHSASPACPSDTKK